MSEKISSEHEPVRTTLREAFSKDMEVRVSQNTIVDLGPYSGIRLPAGEKLTYIAGGVDESYNFFIVRTSSGFVIKMPSSVANEIPVDK